MGGGIGAAANLDVWIVVACMVIGVLAMAWSTLRGRNEAPPQDSVEIPHAPSGPPTDLERPGPDAPQFRLA